MSPVAGDDHVELLRRAHQHHRRRIDEHVRELDIRITGADPRDDFAPELHRVEHIRLVDRANLAAPHPCGP